jgi:uncharacterized protein involved in oxidation of intracellular sulfur
MPDKIVYVISDSPFEKTESVSAVLAQALTALAFDNECEIFLMSEAVNIAKKGATEGLKFKAFEPIDMMIENYIEMGGELLVCHPSSDAREINKDNCHAGVQFVNASRLLKSGKEANALFTF